MVRRKAQRKVVFDDHMAMAHSEVRGVLKYFNLPEQPFWEWMNGQTCPMSEGELGYFWYDVHRYVQNKTNGVPLIWD